MSAHVKTKSKQFNQKAPFKLPVSVIQQLESIYSQSAKNIQKKPYKIATGAFLLLTMTSGIYYLIRFLKNK